MASRTDDPKRLNRRLAELVIEELNRAIPFRHFGRVQRSFNSFLASSTFVRIFTTYYFVKIWNDGRDAIFRTRQQGPLIFFSDLTKDPRVAGGYPRRPSDRKKLTPAEFKRERAAGNLTVTYQVDAAEGEHFIEAAIKAARPKIRAEGLREIRRSVRDIIRTGQRTGVTYLNL